MRVGFWVGNFAGYGSAYAYTGWNSVSRIYVEEVPPPQDEIVQIKFQVRSGSKLTRDYETMQSKISSLGHC